MKRAAILLCCSLLLVHLVQSMDVKDTKDPKEKKKFNSYAEACRADLNECLDHSWAHLPDSPPIGYCCEHYNYCLYGP